MMDKPLRRVKKHGFTTVTGAELQTKTVPDASVSAGAAETTRSSRAGALTEAPARGMMALSPPEGGMTEEAGREQAGRALRREPRGGACTVRGLGHL